MLRADSGLTRWLESVINLADALEVVAFKTASVSNTEVDYILFWIVE